MKRSATLRPAAAAATGPPTSYIPVRFENRQGLQLFGVLHDPSAKASDLAVILLSPGVKMRVGPQRLYLRLAEMLTSAGLPVFRFDFTGLGDSEGTLREEQLKDVYNHIEVGRFVNDTVDAMNWLHEHTRARRFILGGLCGGAITGLLAAATDGRVAGLLGLGITPVLASRAADPARYMTGGQLDRIGRSYVSKLTNPNAWLRVLTLQTDFGLLRRSVGRLFRTRVLGRNTPVAAPPVDDDANPLFPPAFFKMLETGRPLLLVFGGADRLHWEFEEKFVARYKSQLGDYQSAYTVHVIDEANHVLSLDPWQQEFVEVSRNWLRRNFKPDLVV